MRRRRVAPIERDRARSRCGQLGRGLEGGAYSALAPVVGVGFDLINVTELWSVVSRRGVGVGALTRARQCRHDVHVRDDRRWIALLLVGFGCFNVFEENTKLFFE